MSKSNKLPKLSRRSFLKGVGLATAGASLTIAGCDSRDLGNTRDVVLSPPTPAPTPLPIALQYPEVPYTPMQPPVPGRFQVFTPHEARTVEALTARILPGTPDDPGAREAGVVTYIDNMLAFHEGFNEATYRDGPFVQVYSGDQPPAAPGAVVQSQAGPHAEGTPTPTPTPAPSPTEGPTATPTPTITPPPPQGGSITSTDGITGTAALTSTLPSVTQALPAAYEIIWVPSSEIARYGYQSILTPREVYRIGVATLDRYVNGKYGKDFVDLDENQQDEVVGAMVDGKIAAADFDKNLSAESFFHNLRRHTAEGMFGDPVYGGNRDLAGWKLIGYPGAQRAYETWEFQQEGTDRRPQSIMQMNMFAPGQPANSHVVLPVSGSKAGQENR